jgi:hypothetical protein
MNGSVRIHFVLLSEGSGDDALLSHLENLCVTAGADEVTSTAPDFARLGQVGHRVEDKVAAAAILEPDASILFIHRDADNRDAQPRIDEIRTAVASVAVDVRWIAVVPVQETEAWLLIDEQAIRTAAYRPTGRRVLNLPKPPSIERTARPKEVLKEALIQASELTGRRLEKFKRDFPRQRRLLLQQLPPGGPLEMLSSWRRLRDDVIAAITAIRDADSNDE